MAKVDKNGPNGCWLWTASTMGTGYGQFCIDRAKPLGAHRVALFLFRGVEIMEGRAVNIDHLCRNKICVNPDHLEVVTIQENLRRSLAARGMIDACGKGHLFDEKNTRWYRGRRHCRACHNANERAKRRAA